MNESFMTDAKSAKSKGGIWKGHYEQFGQKHEMIFKSFKAKREGKLQGKGKDEIGEFTLKGKVYKDGGLDFKKEYKGRHTVEYSGRLSEDGKSITGDWNVPGSNGGF